MGEYSNDSSRIVMGSAPNRKIGALGLQFERRLYQSRIADLHYAAEWRPVLLESDPTAVTTFQEVAPVAYPANTSSALVFQCIPSSMTFTGIDQGVTYLTQRTISCKRNLTFSQAISPAGFVWNFRPASRLQPTASWLGGIMLSAKHLPVENAGSFNFTYEFGVGLEYYLAAHRSMRLEYHIQHYSNKDTASQNPGVDSGFFKLSYAFGQ